MKILKTIWEKWLIFGKKIGNFQAQVIFTIFYFLILWMIGITTSLFSDFLNIKNKKRKSNFTPWSHPEDNLNEAQKPY